MGVWGSAEAVEAGWEVLDWDAERMMNVKKMQPVSMDAQMRRESRRVLLGVAGLDKC